MAPLRMAVFDLDYTIWEPEMYQIYGPPKRVDDGKTVVDQSGTPITVFDGASYALSEINRMKNNNHPIQAAIASKTDEPKWAYQCMKWLTIQDGSTLQSCFQPELIEIYYGNKKTHLTNLKKKSGIPFESMVFFDNEFGNIQSVKKLGVKCVYTPNGMTREAWDNALNMFD